MNPTSRAPWKIQPSRAHGAKDNLDRFIPNRAATKFDFALDKGWKRTFDPDSISPTKAAYLSRLREVFNIQDQRILAFKNKPRPPVHLFPKDDNLFVGPSKPVPRRQIPKTADDIIDAPDLSDDYCVNLLDWGSNNVLAIGLENIVHLWNAKTNTPSELVTVDDDVGPVTSVSWAPDGSRVAVGLDNSHVQLWDSTAKQLLTTFKGGHQAGVGSLAWNGHILTSGSMDSSIINSDVRVRNPIVDIYQGHRGPICGLKWSQSGRQLASGGNDNLVFIWDQSLASRCSTQWLHRLKGHRAAVRALAWCPFQSNMLATGGGEADGFIKFWNTHTGACLKSYDTGSQVCSLQWSKNDRELLSSHGSSEKELSLWKYPSMARMAELGGHESRVLFTAQSPDGCTVASAGGKTLQFWKVFGAPEVAPEPFSNFGRIR